MRNYICENRIYNFPASYFEFSDRKLSKACIYFEAFLSPPLKQLAEQQGGKAQTETTNCPQISI